jgi:hypothetical protein
MNLAPALKAVNSFRNIDRKQDRRGINRGIDECTEREDERTEK